MIFTGNPQLELELGLSVRQRVFRNAGLIICLPESFLSHACGLSRASLYQLTPYIQFSVFNFENHCFSIFCHVCGMLF